MTGAGEVADVGAGPRRRRVLIEFLRVVPRAAISRLAGRFAGWRLPGRLQRYEIELFARAVGVDLDEVAQPLDSFGSLQEFFTRPLASGARPIDGASDSLVAPCDGLWGESGTVECGRLCQVKGRTYSVASLLGDRERAAAFDGGSYATFYLAPHNYHRFHAPCALRFRAADHLPGTLWPVNRAGLEGVENLFARNERIAAYADVVGAAVAAPLCMVAVGAVMVGKIKLTFDDLTTNLTTVDAPRRRCYEPGFEIDKGGEWGRFEFGSTIVLLAPPGLADLEAVEAGSPVRLGERIGTLRRVSPTAG